MGKIQALYQDVYYRWFDPQVERSVLVRRYALIGFMLLGLILPAVVRAQDASDSAHDPGSGWPALNGGPSRNGLTSDSGPAGVLDLQWRLDTALGGISGSPAISDGVVYVGTGLLDRGSLTAIDLLTGTNIWTTELADNFSAASPSVADGVVYVAGSKGNLFAVDAESGDLLWNTELDDGTTSSPAVDGDALFIGDDGDRLYALDRETGQELWRFDIASGGDYTIDPSPAVADGIVYASTLKTDQDESLFALDVETGQQLWAFSPARPGLATPAIAEGTVYAGGEGGVLYAIDAASGDQRWSAAIGKMASAPAAGNGSVFAHVDGALVAVDAATGTELWRTPIGGIWSSPAIAGDSVVVGGNGLAFEQGLLAANAVTGNLQWNLRSIGSVYSSPAISGEQVVFGSDDGAVYSFAGLTSDGTGANGDGMGIHFSAFTFSTEVDERGLPIDPDTAFPAGTAKLFAGYDFSGMAEGVSFTVTWSLDGEVLGSRDDVWNAGASGHASEHIFANEGNLPPGRYEVVLSIAGSGVRWGSITIG